MPPAPTLDIQHVSKSYGEIVALRDVSLTIPAGTIVALLGPSGCGKTTLLRIIAGLEQADSGELMFEGARIDGVPTHQRGFGLMFQDYALFPHRTVAENIAFGLRMQGVERREITRRVDELLERVGLVGYGPRRVDELSGGERQRVALARSLAPRPRLLMLDEPLGALDQSLRERLLDELLTILKQTDLASLYVTHDQTEAFTIADWLVLMNAGQIEQQGPPQEVYRQPKTLFAARFLGFTNIITGVVSAFDGAQATINTQLGLLHLCANNLSVHQQVTVVLRPEAARLTTTADAVNVIHGTLIERSFRGSRTRITLKTGQTAPLEFELDATNLPAIGTNIRLSIREDSLSVIPEV